MSPKQKWQKQSDSSLQAQGPTLLSYWGLRMWPLAPIRFSEIAFQAACNGCDLQLLAHEHSPDSPSPNTLNELATHWCGSCLNQLLGSAQPSCAKCGAYYRGENPFPDRCQLCHNLDLRFERAHVVGNYRGLLQRLVVQMKRDSNEVLAIQLGRLLGFRLSQPSIQTKFDLIVPLPTHWLRKLKRGFHGAGLIAEGVSRQIRIPVSDKTLIATRLTRKQGTLSANARISNVQNAFALGKKTDVTDKTILLVDDVMTSGATASAATKVLLGGGAKSVTVGVVARGARLS